MAGQAASAGERGFFSCVGRCCGLECGLHGLRSGLRRCLREGEALALFFLAGVAPSPLLWGRRLGSQGSGACLLPAPTRSSRDGKF